MEKESFGLVHTTVVPEAQTNVFLERLAVASVRRGACARVSRL